jgi:hypothetical protein
MSESKISWRLRYVDRPWYLVLMILATPLSLSVPFIGWAGAIIAWWQYFRDRKTVRALKAENERQRIMTESGVQARQTVQP